MPLKRIRLELARNREFPNGSRNHGYELTAPLDKEGHLIAAEWKAAREACRVRRFWVGMPEEHGLLVHRPGGTWVIDYDPGRKSDDEPGFKFDRHRFVPGEYVSITEHDGQQRAFRIVSVLDEAEAAA
jgi:hypothetical protein